MPLRPGKKSPFDIALQDGKSRKEWMLKLSSEPVRDVITDDSNNLYIRNAGKKIGDFDEQRDWKGGMGNEFFNEDPSGWFDGSAYTLAKGHLLPPLKWRYATGYRTTYSNFVDSMSFRALLGVQKYITVAVTTGAITADACWVWIRRHGNPSDLTLELCANSAGNPDTVLKTATVSTSTITDIISVLYKFDWTGTQSLSGATTYHIKLYGGTTSNDANHWEIGVDTGTSLSKYSSDGSSWTAADYSTQIRIVDAEIARRFFFHNSNSGLYITSKRDSGNSDFYSVSDVTLTAITSTGLGTVTGRPIYVNGTHFFPQGEADVIRRWNEAGGNFADEAAGMYATYLVTGSDSADGPIVWRGNSTTGASGNVSVSRAKTLSAGAPIAFASDGTSMLTWGTAIPLGGTGTGLNNIYFWTNNGLYAFKSDAVYSVSNDRATYLDYGLKNAPSTYNGLAIVAHQQFLYWNWLFSVERLYGGSLDDIGLGWKGPSLPSGREGYYSAFATYINLVFAAIDAEDGVSSVQAWDGLSWHEVFRAPAAGMRIRDIGIQTYTNWRTRLWIDCGGELIYIKLPLRKANPLYDPDMAYMHEGYLVSSTIDMGTASKLPKFIKELTATAANLNGAGIRVEVDYQVDQKIGLSGYNNWITAQPFTYSPEDTIPIGEPCTQFRYRLRLQTDTATTPPDIKGIVPSGHARGAFKWTWNFTVTTGGGKGRNKVDRDEFDAWLTEAGRTPGRIKMTSTWHSLHNYDVVIAPPRMRAIRPPTKNKQELDSYSFTLIEV